MSFFKQIEGEAAILVTNGVYQQVDVYTRDGYLYAKHGGGFVRLMADGSTSKAKTHLNFLSLDEVLYARLGRLCLRDVGEAKPLSIAASAKLLGGA